MGVHPGRLSYAERLRMYEKEKRQISFDDFSPDERQEILKRLAQKWKI